ncbi:lipoprotein NlpI [Pseudoalteromonas xiamenensis]|uniref:Lipoprotein NlpI n=1 Tax=Pseudoalteromonas xiamenensis TaxID=882626 RepID=A0A975DI39_9GAMM|nr:lipoprotein NlpI [Pseudoalteromonas xiamenensis]QTH72105.1 lipoprotein NlpI [Pseudoalteromonas xiamenensis]
MKLKPILFAMGALSILAGCQSTSTPQAQPVLNVPFGIPLIADYRNEIAIARFSELLARTELPADQQAQLLYDRGVLYDSLGLTTLARIDFNRAVKMKPDLAEVYNFLGIHHTLLQQYEQAYEMFDAVIELNNKHDFAYLNRGIALYYGERADLAEKDFSTFLARAPKDPYRALWLYLAQSHLDDAAAAATLRENRAGLDNASWAVQIVDLYLGNLSESDFLSNLSAGIDSQQAYAERLCEAYFYLAKLYQARGEKGVAADFFKLALATNVYEFVEHKYARLELDLMRGMSEG